MANSGIFSAFSGAFKKIARRQTSHTGIVFGLIISVLAIILIAGGFLTGMDDFLTSLVFQYGYQGPDTHPLLIVAKKDQATSELIGKNPGREEFASMFELLGQQQEIKREGGGKARPHPFFVFSVGNFQNLDWENVPIVRTSMSDLDGSTRTLSDLLYEKKVKPLGSLVKIESNLFSPISASVLRALSGKKNSFWQPSLGLYNSSEGLFWVDIEGIYKENLKRGKDGLKPVFPTIAQVEKMVKNDDFAADQAKDKAEDLMQRWQTLFCRMLNAKIGARLFFSPDENTLFEIHLQTVFDPLPENHTVDPAAVIAFDFILQGEKTEEIDSGLEAAIERSKSGVILSAHTKLEEEFEQDSSAYEATQRYEKLDISLYTPKKLVTRLIMPDKRFLKPNTTIGMIDVGVVNKSFVSQVPMFIPVPEERTLKPSFSLVTALSAFDQQNPTSAGYLEAMYQELERIYPEVASGTFNGPLKIKDLVIPVNAKGQMYVKFYGSTQKNKFKNAAIRSLSFYQLFTESHLKSFMKKASKRDQDRLKRAHRFSMSYGANKGGKIILAGPFESSDFDFYATPMSIRTPYTIQSQPLMGVEIHANAVLNILNRDHLKHPNQWQRIFTIFVTCILLGLILDFLSPLIGLAITLSFMGGISWYALYSYHQLGQVFNFSSMLFAYPAIWGLSTLTNYLRQRAKAQNTKQMFSRFVAADVVQYMLENPELVKPGGEKVELTIFFSDVAGFTSISEALTPEELVVLLNEYLGAMTDLLFEYGGTLDKFIGDAVMAFWNYPKKQSDHAERACLCALAMQRKINELQLGWAERGLPRVSARAGLNTANVVVGYMGSNKAQMNFTCMGDGVNLASRLEGANKEYDTAMMISDATYQKAKNKVTARFLDFLAVKGKKEPVKVFELVSEKGKEPPEWNELAEMYDQAIQLHLDRNWNEAIATFEKILARWPEDGPSATYLKRCHEYIQNPPPENWDGRYILTHK